MRNGIDIEVRNNYNGGMFYEFDLDNEQCRLRDLMESTTDALRRSRTRNSALAMIRGAICFGQAKEIFIKLRFFKAFSPKDLKKWQKRIDDAEVKIEKITKGLSNY